ncbi:6-bladed beta-propeller [uncultured Roseivirga sp.]|uniref:6-bladed beta-propeller n=1 Tax=uncultured Roseivirga sp. TaxID=543088 RepID=UPI0030D77B26|tara:strand:- start:10101 stop:11297 length:1197 start_codon:yes stop_codon:yes gene_type:complete
MKSTKETLLISGLIVIIIFLTSSCGSNSGKQSSESTSEGIEVISIADIKVSKLSDVIDNISYTALKDHPEHRAYRIDKVLIEDGLIYIFDYYSGRSLSVYDLKGNFQFAITKPGQGPNQYLSIQDFLVDKSKVEVLDARGKLVFYDNQGIFERSEKLPFSAQAFLKRGNDYQFQTGKIPNELGRNGKSCEVVQYNLETKKSDCLLEIHNGKDPHSFRERNILKNTASKTYYGTYFNDTIYEKQDNSFVPEVILDFSPDALPPEMFEHNSPYDDYIGYLNKNKDKAYHTPSLQGNANFLITQFSKSNSHHLIYDIKNGSKIVLKTTAKNDVDGGLPLYWAHTINDRDIIMIFDSENVLAKAYKLQQEKSKFNQKEQAFLNFTNAFNPEDPLVMISYHLK